MRRSKHSVCCERSERTRRIQIILCVVCRERQAQCQRGWGNENGFCHAARSKGAKRPARGVPPPLRARGLSSATPSPLKLSRPGNHWEQRRGIGSLPRCEEHHSNGLLAVLTTRNVPRTANISSSPSCLRARASTSRMTVHRAVAAAVVP